MTSLALASLLAHAGGAGVGAAAANPFPPWVLWTAGAGVVAVSFGVVGGFLTRPDLGLHERDEQPRAVAPAAPATYGRVGSVLLAIAAAIVVAAALGALPAAAARIVVWLGLWAILPMVAYFVADPWPWRASPAAAHAVRWVAWAPAVTVLLLSGLEVTPTLGGDPRLLAGLALAYAAVAAWRVRERGMAAWTREDPLARVFATWAQLAPFWRAPTRLAKRDAAPFSQAALVVALLYGASFDGFLRTRVGLAALDALAPAGELLSHAIILATGYALFLLAFLACAWLVRSYARVVAPTTVVAASFAPALLPIAAGYHLAHNAPYLIEQSGGIPLALYPWLVGFQMVAIVAAHVLAVVVAHRVAFARFDSRVQAVRSELPLTLLMVLYTFVGLWLVAGSHAPALPVALVGGLSP